MYKTNLIKDVKIISIFVIILVAGYYIMNILTPNTALKMYTYTSSRAKQLLQKYTSLATTRPSVTITYTYPCTLFKNFKVIFSDKKICVVEGALLNDTILIAYPQKNTSNNLLPLYFYSHGQDEILNKNSSYTKRIERIAKEYAYNNSVFIASNLQGNNWGSKSSQQELLNLIDIIQHKFSNSQSLNLIAFSMGGMLAYRMTANHPHFFHQVKILAGTLPYNVLTPQSCKNIMSNNITIYHGTADINVPFSQSSEVFIKYCKNKIGKAPQLIIKQGFDHWQVGTLGYKELWKN